MTASLGINARHRRHYKSGSCLEQHPLEEYKPNGKKFRRLMEYFAEQGRQNRNFREASEAIDQAAAERRARSEQPRSTQSLFGRVKSKILGLFGRAAA